MPDSDSDHDHDIADSPARRSTPTASRDGGSGSTEKGLARRQEIVEAAAALLRENGPSVVTHRAVARRAGCSLSAMTYYFSGLEQLHSEAGAINIGRWAARAERVADHAESLTGDLTREQAIELAFEAMNPEDEQLLPHYMQLIAAGASEPVRAAYHGGRGRLNHAMSRVLTRVGSQRSPDLVIAVIDGAAVTAISEGVPLRSYALPLLADIL